MLVWVDFKALVPPKAVPLKTEKDNLLLRGDSNVLITVIEEQVGAGPEISIYLADEALHDVAVILDILDQGLDVLTVVDSNFLLLHVISGEELPRGTEGHSAGSDAWQLNLVMHFEAESLIGLLKLDYDRAADLLVHLAEVTVVDSSLAVRIVLGDLNDLVVVSRDHVES